MATYDLKYPGAAIDAILDTAYDLQNAGYIFRGLASEYSNTPTERSWVLAGEGETGHGFTSPIPKGYIGVCVFDGTSWTGKLVKCVSIDSTPTSGSGNAISSGGAYASINNLATFIDEALDNLTFTDTTPSAFLGDYIKMKVSTTDGGIERILTYFTILAATAEKAGLLSAADKAKLDAILGNLRSLEIDDTTAYADLGTKIVESIKATIGGTEETISTFQILAATASKAGLLSAADKAKLDALWSSGYQFAGIATPSTTPISTTSKIFYIATEAGTYFNAVTVTQGINILSWNGSAWSIVQVIGIDDEPTADSLNLPRSGGVYNWIRDIGSKANSVYGEYFLDLSHVFDSSRYEYKRSNLYDTAWVCLLKGSAKIIVTGAVVTTIRYFSSFDELNESTSIETNTSGIVPEGAKLAHVILKKEYNPSGYDNMTITQYDLLDNVNDNFPKGLFFHPDHLIANADSQNAIYEASSLWDCFHVIICGQHRINIDGLNEGTTYRFYNDMNIFDGQPIASKLTGKNTTGIVPEGSVICVVNMQKSAYPNGYDDFRLVNNYTDTEYARQNGMAINKGFYIDKNHILRIVNGVVTYEENNSWNTLVVFTEGAKKIHVNGLNDGVTYRFFDSADIFTGEDIAEHLIEANKTGLVPDGAVVSINAIQHSTYPDGYADFSIEKEYGNDDMKAINMLLIGNSAAQDAISYVPFILNNMGIGKVRIGLLMQSDSTIAMHLDNFTNESSVYTFYLFDSGSSWQNLGKKTIQFALNTYDWDIVVLHQAANSNASTYFGSIQPQLNQIVNLISAYVEYSIKFVWYQNQARPGAANKGANWSDEVITQHYENSVTYCQRIAQETIFEYIIPVGTAIQNARTIPTLKAMGDYADIQLNTSGLGYLTYDGIHLQEGLPCQIAAYTFVLALLDLYGWKEHSINGESTRVTSDWVQGKNIPGPHGECVGSTDENCLIAQKCAIMAIKNPFEVTDMSYIINPTEIQTT